MLLKTLSRALCYVAKDADDNFTDQILAEITQWIFVTRFLTNFKKGAKKIGKIFFMEFLFVNSKNNDEILLLN